MGGTSTGAHPFLTVPYDPHTCWPSDPHSHRTSHRPTFSPAQALDRSKWKLTEDERAAGGGAQPLLDPYDNHLVMSLKVGGGGAHVCVTLQTCMS